MLANLKKLLTILLLFTSLNALAAENKSADKSSWWYRPIYLGTKSTCKKVSIVPKNAAALPEFAGVVQGFEKQIKSQKIPADKKAFIELARPRCSSVKTKVNSKLYLVYCFAGGLRDSNDIEFLMSRTRELCAKEVYDSDSEKPDSFHLGAAIRALTSSNLGMSDFAAARLQKDAKFFTQSALCMMNYSKSHHYKLTQDLLIARPDAFKECELSNEPSNAQRNSCDKLVAKNVALGGSKQSIEGWLSWPGPVCECQKLKAKMAANNREVCVCSRTKTRCESNITVESYPSSSRKDPWNTDVPKTSEITPFALEDGELFSPDNVMLFNLDNDSYVALVLPHKYAQNNSHTIRPMLIFGSLATKKTAIGYQAKKRFTDDRHAFEVRTNTVKKTVQLFHSGKLEWAGTFKAP